MKKKLFLLLLTLSILCPSIFALACLKKDAQIYDRVLRLHVIAQSDTEQDQALKLKVRDAILSRVQTLLADCTTKDDAENAIASSIDQLVSCANETLENQGSDQRATISIVDETYPTKSYESFRLPGGTYRSVKVEIGRAQGQNWWCVLFPSLCLSASSADTEGAFLSAGFSPDQVHLLTDTEEKTYVIRFRLLEWLGDLFS